MPPIRESAGLEALRPRARRLLAVFPHPDDESYGCAGTLARLGADPDGAGVVLCLTRGEASSMGPERGLSPAEVGDLRFERLNQVAQVLKLAGMVVEPLPDGRMVRLPLDEVAHKIDAAVQALQPQVIVGHDPRGVNAHPDHIATHWALRHALLRHPGVRFAMLAYPPELAEALAPRLLFPTPEEEIDAVIELTEPEIEAKEACLRIHEALITLREDGDPALLRRPPVGRYDFLGEDCTQPLTDLFA